MPYQENILISVSVQNIQESAHALNLNRIIDRTRAEPGCIEFRLSENVETGTLHLYEEWQDEAALKAHHEQPYTVAVFKAYESWLAEEPEIVRLRPVA